MSKLKAAREKVNLTQEELAEQSGVSVRTIQRIEAGTDPKGYTLKVLAKTLGVEQDELLKAVAKQEPLPLGFLKLVNLSSLPVAFLPPLNIIIPWVIMLLKKELVPMAKQLVSVQILWTVAAFVLFMLSAFLRNWLSMSNGFTLVVMILLALSNIALILWNAITLDKKKAPAIRLKFSLV
ncbi:helix-turn-helix domain-containing protein [Sediminibacterium goheungense]|uniref:Transcriptional regulator with XRE-family HTH domain n=1 Tax=Sediminibacterium goheungense TaxID=1086393 RepID=A0A4R6IWB4_9BACT|nr:helix-turn-helix domain-containing protein [Sediminibacterium goheungense]TDO26296.1 transcriptional regulator with XRE-family HTH domain [Sediminibacterium goheungense]